MDIIRSIIKSRSFLDMDEGDKLERKHYFLFFVKLSCYIVIAWLIVMALYGLSFTRYGNDYGDYGETYPY